MKPAPDTGLVPLEPWQDLAPHAPPGVCGVGVRRVFERHHSTPGQEVDDLIPPDRQERAHKRPTPGGHAAKTCDPAPAEKMEHDAFDNVVGCMAERDDRGRGLD